MRTLALALVVLLSASPAEAALIVRDLGTLGGRFSRASDINASGQVVGESAITGISPRHAFLYSDGVLTDLGTLGGRHSDANAINDSGQVVGYSYIADSDTIYHAFLYSGGVMTDLGALGERSQANDINNSGQIVGKDIDKDYHGHAFLYSGGVMDYLDYSVAENDGAAVAINASGQVVGYSSRGTWYSSATVYSSGGVTDLDLGRGSIAHGINDSGQIVGGAIGGAFLYSDGTKTDLGTLGGWNSSASDINASGQVVGYSYIGDRPDSRIHGFLYRDGVMIDLNSLIEPGSGWTITNASGINDRGQIAATGFNASGESRALRLDPQELAPVPEPSTLAMAGTALALLGLAAARRRGRTDA